MATHSKATTIGVVVAEVVTVVVEMVASQAWYSPPTYASAISFSAVAAPVHSAVSTNEAPTPHSIAARLLASAAELPDRGSQRGVGEKIGTRDGRRVAGDQATRCKRPEPQEIVPVAVGYNPRIELSTATGAVQLISECNDSGDEVQATAALKTVLVGVVMTVVVVIELIVLAMSSQLAVVSSWWYMWFQGRC